MEFLASLFLRGRKEQQERDPFTDLRRLSVTNLVSFFDTAIVKNVFTFHSFLEKFSYFFKKVFPFHTYFLTKFFLFTPLLSVH